MADEMEIYLNSPFWTPALELELPVDITFVEIHEFLTENSYINFPLDEFKVTSQTGKDVPHNTTIKNLKLPNKKLQVHISRHTQSKLNLSKSVQLIEVQQPIPPQKNNEVIVIINLKDGIDDFKIELKTDITSSFDDIKKDLYSHIMNNNLCNYWRQDEEINVNIGNKAFQKTSQSFKKMNLAKDGKVYLNVIRVHPGGF